MVLSSRGSTGGTRLPDGTEVDLTLSQFRDGQVVSGARVRERPVGRPLRREEEYLRLRVRVMERLGVPDVHGRG